MPALSDVVSFLKRGGRAIRYRSMRTLFFAEPRPGLELLFALGLDIELFCKPYFKAHNMEALQRLRQLREAGRKPRIVLFATEGDGRFERLDEMSMAATDDNMILFRFPIQTAASESIIFAEHTRRGCGFYEDARMKYIDPINKDARDRYRAYCRRLLSGLESIVGPIDIFMSGSNHDRYVVELISAAQERGITWVCAEREGTGTAYTYQNEAECYLASDTVTSDYFIVANDGHRHMFDFSRKPSVKDIFIMGDLDTDWWFHWDRRFTRREYREWDKYEKKVLFLTFGIRNYVSPYAFPNNPEFNWIQLLDDAEDEIFRFALENPNVLVFYKMGHVEDNNPKFIERCRQAGLTNVVPLDRSFPCNELILYSDLTIGFQTTAMYEAMFHTKPLFYVEWAIDPGIDRATMLLPLATSGACRAVRSKEEFAAMLSAWAKDDASLTSVSDEELRARVATRETMFNFADGHISERVWQKLLSLPLTRRAAVDAR